MRRAGAAALVLAAILGALPAAADEPEAGSDRRVIVLAFDGVDPRLAERWMASGDLPHLAALAAEGTFSPLATTNPADSPTSWASFVTATNPGRTGVFGFARPIPDRYGIEPVIGLTERGPYGPGRAARAGLALAAGAVAFALFYGVLRLAGRSRVAALLTALAAANVLGAGAAYALLALVPGSIDRPVPARDGRPFWDAAAAAGRPVVCVAAPMCYPPEPVPDCRLVCGFGVPDALGTMGVWTLYSSGILRERTSQTAGRLVPIPPEGRVRTTIAGPDDPLVAQEVAGLEGRLEQRGEDEALRQAWRDARRRLPLSAPLEIAIDRPGDRVELEVDGTTAVLVPGEWSDWIELRFGSNPLLPIRGMVRFRLLSVSPVVEVYMTPVQYVPTALPPGVVLSTPEDWAGRLWSGGFRLPTVGWPTATNALKDERIDEAAFLETVRQEFDAQREVALAELERGDWSVLLAFFYAPDRASHLLWRLLDPRTPEDVELAKVHGDGILETYRWMDDLVGEVRRRFVDARTTLLVVSDHGFAPFRKEVDLNAWLRAEGLLVLAGDPTLPAGLDAVDWSRTRAYAVGLGGVRFNRKGREPEGIVAPEEADALAARIASGLLEFRDPDSGVPVVRRVDRREDVYRGPRLEDAPDLQIGFAEGYRVGWGTYIGETGSDVVALNANKWSGDHVSVDPDLVPGVLFSNARLRTQGASIEDVGPTILALLGVPLPPDLDGAPLPSIGRGP